jgi:transposase-like protein
MCGVEVRQSDFFPSITPGGIFMPRIRYSEAVRDRAVRLVLESQIPIAQVARKIGCSVNTVHLWLKCRRPGSKSGHREEMSEEESASFTPVNLIDPKAAAIEIVTPNGFTLKLAEANLRFIAELLRELAAC